MKNLLTLTFILVAFVTMNCSSPQENAAVEVQADKQLALKVDGMVCAVGCAKYIEKQVSQMAGVSSCTVNFEEGTAAVEFSSEITDQKEIVESIAGLNDGQYGVTVVGEKDESPKKSSSGSQGEGEEVNETEVSFHFPELVTYFMSRIIR